MEIKLCTSWYTKTLTILACMLLYNAKQSQELDINTRKVKWGTRLHFPWNFTNEIWPITCPQKSPDVESIYNATHVHIYYQLSFNVLNYILLYHTNKNLVCSDKKCRELRRKQRREEKMKRKEERRQRRLLKKQERLRKKQSKSKSKKGSKLDKSSKTRAKRAATARPERLWDYGVIPYEIEANFSGKQWVWTPIFILTVLKSCYMYFDWSSIFMKVGHL